MNLWGDGFCARLVLTLTSVFIFIVEMHALLSKKIFYKFLRFAEFLIGMGVGTALLLFLSP